MRGLAGNGEGLPEPAPDSTLRVQQPQLGVPPSLLPASPARGLRCAPSSQPLHAILLGHVLFGVPARPANVLTTWGARPVG